MPFPATLANVLSALGVLERPPSGCLVCEQDVDADDPSFAGEPVHYECVFSLPQEALIDRVAERVAV